MAKKQKEKKGKKGKVKICPACHAEIPVKAKLCPYCAEKQKTKSKLPLIIILVVLLLLVGAFVSMAIFEFPVALPFDVPFLSGSKPETIVGETMELTRDQEKEVLAGLEESGFAEIKEVDLIKYGAKSSTYAVQDIWTAQFMEKDDAAVVEIANGEEGEKTLDKITFQGQEIYADGKVTAPITDYYLTLAQRDDYLADTLDAVKKELAVPETAVFPARSGWSFEMDGGNVTVASSVTAREGSGQTVTRSFTAYFTDGELSSLTFDGEGE